MTLISKKKITKIMIILTFFLNSCESFKIASGITKPTMEDDLVNETPELILPPDFESRPMESNRNSYQDRNNTIQQNSDFSEERIDNRQFVQPRTQNIMAPRVELPLSTSPSDSIEKFSRNRRFTLGQWVYENSVNSFRQGNIYYRPIYDKGYNFSRRYTPNSQIQEVIVPQPLLTPSNNSFYQYENLKLNNLNYNLNLLGILEKSSKIQISKISKICILAFNLIMNKKMLQFVDVKQEPPEKRGTDGRKGDFNEIYKEYITNKASEQSSRCSQCGVPFCQIHCPLGNNIPDWLKLTAEGRLKEAYEVSQSTNNMPEVCGRICPQDRLCEGNCVIEQSGHGTVTIGSIEKYITDTAWDKGWVKPFKVKKELKQSVGIIGAGPAGMACAEELRKSGYQVTIYDRYDRPGGLLIYGIPNFKLEKFVVERRTKLLKESGIKFELNFEVGRDKSLYELKDKHDAILIATGVYKARTVGNGSLWFDTRQGRMFVYFDDGTTDGWYQTNGGDGYTIVSPNAPTTEITGVSWFDTTNNKFYVWDSTQWRGIDASITADITAINTALSTLKTEMAAATNIASIKAAVATALANF